MNVIKCELCGSNELRKIDGEYECIYCHTKYTLEEAKKLMVEIEGTVKIDTSSKEENYKKLAERAFKDELYDQAYDYYNKLLELDSDNWEFVFKKGLCAAWQSTLANFRIDEAVKASKNSFNIIEVENIKLENKEKVCYEMAYEINKVVVAFCNLAQNHYTEFWETDSAAPDYWSQLEKCISCNEYAMNLIKEYTVIDKDRSLYISILKNLIVYCVEICAKRKYKSGYNQYGPTYGDIWYKNELRAPILQKYDMYVAELRPLEPNYVPPTLTRQATKGGCYVATCVYGSYDCPEVWTLRRFRDYYLDERKWGKVFINIYYKISPKVVKVFGRTKWFQKIFRYKLDKMVKKLKIKGYQSAPYEDKY